MAASVLKSRPAAPAEYFYKQHWMVCFTILEVSTMQLASWRIGFCLAILARVCLANAGTVHGGAGLESCSALVHYYAVSGSPLRAENSSVFRGFIHVEDQRKQKIHKEATLSWTFPRGETIQAGDNVFRNLPSNGTHARKNVSFTLSMDASMAQRVEIKYLTDDTAHDFGFVADKGSTAMGSGAGDGVGLPTSVKHNGMKCKQVTGDFDQMSWHSNNTTDTHLKNNVLSLEYLPIEKKKCRYGSGCSSTSTSFIIRLTNTGTKPIYLKDVELEYWFDEGATVAGASTPVFYSGCHLATEGVDTKDIIVSVHPGYRGVLGAHYKAVISFRPTVGYLKPEKHTSLSIDNTEIPLSERGLDHLEAIIQILSLQPQAYLDATKDYSFLRTNPFKDQSDPKHVTREFAVNLNMPVILHGSVVSGTRPLSNLLEEKQANQSTQLHELGSWLQVPDSGLNATYCCSKPRKSFWKRLPLWLIVEVICTVLLLFFFGCLYYFRSHILRASCFWRKTGVGSELALTGVGTEQAPASDRSMACSSNSHLSSLIDSDLIYRNVNYETEIEPHLTYANRLGRGAYGAVYKINFRGEVAAIKVVDVHDKDLSKCTQEINLASYLNSDYNVKLMGAFPGKNNTLCLIMEFVNGGNLSQRIYDRNRPPLEYIEVLNMCLDIARGLVHLHQKMAHLDLNPNNVLLTNEGRCKIADFRLARRMEDHETHLTLSGAQGTICYMAPEILDNLEARKKSDIYSFGCLVNEALARKRPFSELSDTPGKQHQIWYQVAKLDKPPQLAACPDDMAELIQDCWKREPESRPSASDIVPRLENMISKEQSRAQQGPSSPPINGSHASTSSDKVIVEECEIV